MLSHKWVYLATSAGSSEELLPVLFRCCDCGAVERFRSWDDSKCWLTVDDLENREASDHDR